MEGSANRHANFVITELYSKPSQNGCFKKTKHGKFSEKRTLRTPRYAHDIWLRSESPPVVLIILPLLNFEGQFYSENKKIKLFHMVGSLTLIECEHTFKRRLSDMWMT